MLSFRARAPKQFPRGGAAAAAVGGGWPVGARSRAGGKSHTKIWPNAARFELFGVNSGDFPVGISKTSLSLARWCFAQSVIRSVRYSFSPLFVQWGLSLGCVYFGGAVTWMCVLWGGCHLDVCFARLPLLSDRQERCEYWIQSSSPL